MSRGEKISLGVAAFGVGVTVVTTALGLADVDMSAAVLWLMGGVGVVLMFGGAVGALMSWRQQSPPEHHPVLRSYEMTAARSTEGHQECPLKATLVRERAKGRRWLSGLGIAAMASPLLPHTTQDDVAGWEANVRHLLRHEPGLLTMFNYVPPEGSLVGLAYIATVDAVTGGKAAARLRRRLAQLDRVIESL